MRARALAAVALALLTLTACSKVSPDATASDTSADIDEISIGVSDGLAPTITLPEGKTFTEPQGKVVFEGDGAPLVDNQPLLLDVYGVSLSDGSEIVNTFDGLPRSYVLAREVLGDNLYDLLIDGNVGMRVLVVAPATKEGTLTPGGSSAAPAPEPTVALVVDVLSDRAVGTEIEPRTDLPTVTVDKDTGEPTITIPDDLKEPTTVQSETLIQGNGLQVKDGSYILVNYKAVRWKDGTEYSSSWPEDTAPFSTQLGTGQLIPALDEALLDQTTGSQVLVVAPPQFGYPEEGTLVFVVDILDVWTPVE
ncbi:MAG: FKBP-type peptidyl-prolyl cis-trans isomerase [Demequina sp.]|jgi:peptidylprolyl isomerase|nr:FKBP-type peptidyl-prolyl cis-trans isomerase [Demequina sp.]